MLNIIISDERRNCLNVHHLLGLSTLQLQLHFFCLCRGCLAVDGDLHLILTKTCIFAKYEKCTFGIQQLISWRLFFIKNLDAEVDYLYNFSWVGCCGTDLVRLVQLWQQFLSKLVLWVVSHLKKKISTIMQNWPNVFQTSANLIYLAYLLSLTVSSAVRRFTESQRCWVKTAHLQNCQFLQGLR